MNNDTFIELDDATKLFIKTTLKENNDNFIELDDATKLSIKTTLKEIKNIISQLQVSLLFNCWNWNEDRARCQFKKLLQDNYAFRYVIDEFVKRFISQDISKCILIFDLQDEHVTEYFLDTCIREHGDKFIDKAFDEFDWKDNKLVWIHIFNRNLPGYDFLNMEQFKTAKHYYCVFIQSCLNSVMFDNNVHYWDVNIFTHIIRDYVSFPYHSIPLFDDE